MLGVQELVENKERKKFHDCIPPMMETLEGILNSGNEEKAQELLDVLNAVSP